MGLDITAYSQLVPAKPGTDDDHLFPVRQSKDFPNSIEGLPIGDYEFEEENTFDFMAGSYSGYNAWREQLAKLAGYPPAYSASRLEEKRYQLRHDQGAWNATGGPFWELINFSDCEGIIGPKHAAKLLKDFQEFETRAMEHSDSWFRKCYKEWQYAFGLAAQNGAVDFH